MHLHACAPAQTCVHTCVGPHTQAQHTDMQKIATIKHFTQKHWAYYQLLFCCLKAELGCNVAILKQANTWWFIAKEGCFSEINAGFSRRGMTYFIVFMMVVREISMEFWSYYLPWLPTKAVPDRRAVDKMKTLNGRAAGRYEQSLLSIPS